MMDWRLYKSLFVFLFTQEHAASFPCVHVWQESTLSYPATPATCMASLRTLAMAMAGPCFVPGEALVSLCWLGSSVPWPLPWARLLARQPTSQGRRTEPCDRGVVTRLTHWTLMFNFETVFVCSPCTPPSASPSIFLFIVPEKEQSNNKCHNVSWKCLRDLQEHKELHRSNVHYYKLAFSFFCWLRCLTYWICGDLKVTVFSEENLS